MYRIFKVTEKAINNQMDWDAAIEAGEIETVEEFPTLEAAEKAYRGMDEDLYGMEAI